MIGRPAPW